MSNPNVDRDRDRGDVNYRRGASPPRSGNFNNNNYRGANRGGRGGGRGGYRPRRYWDNDELYRRERQDYDDRGRDRERRRGRRSRSYSRSPSRSRSRSRSDSRSRSRSRTPDKSPKRGTEEYQPKSVPGSTSNISTSQQQQQQQQYEPAYTPQKSNVIGQQSAVEHLYAPQSQQHTNGQSIHYSETSRHDYPLPPPPPVQNYKKQNEMPMVVGPEAAAYYGASVPPNFSAQREYGSFTQNITYVPTGLNSQQQQQPNPSSSTPTDSKGKGKDKKKKKRRQRSSSSSSSSSSSESSDSDSRSKGKRKSRRSGSSDSSSEEDRNKEKSKKAGKGVTPEQKKALVAQKENYSAKLQLLENNIRLLMQKEYELRDTNADPALIEENKKLQNEIRARCQAVQTVLDKINDILQPGSNETKPPCPPPPPIISQKVSQPPPQVQHAVQPQVAPRKRVEQYDFYDNGEHWCRLCNVFPQTIQDMLDHFHSKEHHAQVEQLGIEEKPWRKQRPYQENAVVPGAKKVPFKGMQFFSPVQGWYCRICNIYMGDHEGAIEHLKCEDHTENYLNFLDEHPDWEGKWSSDRQKARGRAGFQNQEIQSRSSHGRSGREEDVEDAKSIRIQMRNSVKADENRSSALPFTTKTTEQQSKVDAVVDEWMGKPQKVKLDIDTQKFAEIVRQKHGQKEKEMLAAKHSESSKSSGPPPPPIIREKEQDRNRSSREREQSSRKSGGNDSTSRRGNTVEMNLSNARDRERNRYSGSRGGRRRSRSRSNSRSRSRSRGRDNSRERYRRRSSRSRSPAPSRHRDIKDVDKERNERVKPTKEKEKPPTPEVKETAVKKLPIIGKMPLFGKKPIISSLTKDKIKSQEEGAAAVTAQKLAESKRNSEAVESMIQSLVRDSPKNITALKTQAIFPTSTTLKDSKFSLPMSGTSFTGFTPSSSTTPQPVKPPVLEEIVVPKMIRREAEIPMPSHPMMMMNPSNGATGGLPDDLQQALDIIYSAPPPPEKIARDRFGPSRFGSGPPPGFEFPPNNYGSYHSHQHHHHHQQQHPKPNIPTSVPPPKPAATSSTIAPYGSNVYEELDDRPPGEDDGPPGVDDGPPGVNNIPPPKIVPPPIIETKKPPPQEIPIFKPPPIDDDIEDLRMLGIDVDDAAAAAIR